jgi:hypothetical protein
VFALVIALDNVAPIPDGSTLYTCRLAIRPDAALGAHPLTSGQVNASDPTGEPIPVVGADGAITVEEAAGVRIDVQTVDTTTSEAPVVEVFLTALSDEEQNVTTVEHMLRFSPRTPIEARIDGQPDCEVNPSIDKGAVFTYLPGGCTPGVDCTQVYVLLTDLDDPSPIPTGTQLYSCRLRIEPGTPDGSYILAATDTRATDDSGNPISAVGSIEEIRVSSECPGDCNGDARVTIDELILGVNIALGSQQVAACEEFDSSADRQVTIDELIKAVNAALNGCEV